MYASAMGLLDLEDSDAIHYPAGIDLQDALGAPIFVLASLVTLLGGTVSLTLFDVAFGFGDVLFTLGTLDFTTAWVAATIVLAIAAGTNEIGSYSEDWHRYVPLGMLAIHFVTLFPAGQDVFTSSDIVGVAGLMVMSAGYYMVSYY